MEQVANVEVCRLCANFYMTGAEVEFVGLFHPIAGLEAQLEFIQTQLIAWRLFILPDDGLPQRICANCFTHFCGIQAFRQQCEEAQQKLLESFSKADESNKPVQETAVVGTVDAAGATENQLQQSVAINSNESFNALASMQTPDAVDELVNDLKSIEPLDVLQPATTNAEIIASLNEMQMPQESQLVASVTESLASYMDYTQDYTTMHNNSLLDACNNLITTHATLDTKTEQTDVLRFAPAISSEDSFITQMQFEQPVTAVAQPIMQKDEIDLEDMLQGSIIPKKNSNVEEVELKDKQRSNGVVQQQGLEDYVGSECEDGEDFEPDVSELAARLMQNPFACQYCYCPTMGTINHLVFSSADALSQHFFDVHDPNLPYTCPYCPQKYNSVKQRDYHVRLMHSIATQLEHCKYCQKTLRTSSEHHLFNCAFVGNWKCDICGEDFEQVPMYRFRSHQRQHESSRQYRCKTCGRMFIRRANMEAHERMHRIQEATMIRCDQCKSVFSGDYELRRHKYQVHSGELPVKCEHCKKGFVSMAFLTRHVQHFHPAQFDSNPLDAATCTNCGTIFESLVKLRQHLQRPRDENGRCIDTCRTNSKVIRRRARQQVTYVCPHCAKRFISKPQLEKHLNTHEARLRPFQCEKCSTRCRTMAELQKHMDTMHQIYFECEVCAECYTSKEEFNLHMLTHNDEGYECNVMNCGYIAFDINELNEHARTKHRLIPCEYCGGLYSRQRLATHLRTSHRAEIDVMPTNDTEEIEAQLVEGDIVHENEKISNGELVSTFEDNMLNGEKVRVELVNSAGPINSLVLQEQMDNNYKSLLIPNETADMENHFFMGSLLDPDHEIIVA